MSLSNDQADEIYSRTKSELEKIAFGRRGTTAEQRQAALRKCNDLDINYIGSVIKRIEDRTAKFQHFIDEMQALINQFESDSTLRALKELKNIVSEASGLIAES